MRLTVSSLLSWYLLPVTMVLSTSTVLGENVANCTIRSIDDPTLEELCWNGKDTWYIMGCNNMDLTQVPSSYRDHPKQICLLDLSSNLITTVNESAFINIKDIRLLYLSENNITFIHGGAFTGLSQLVYLNLTQNNLSSIASFGKGVFKPFANLTNINMKQNMMTSFDGLGEEMQYMKKLEGLFINACSDCVFGPGFENLTNLASVSLSGRSPGACNMSYVRNSTFTHLPQIKRLWISSCNISSIGANAFSPLKRNLELLDISYNDQLTFKGMNAALYGLRNSSNLGLLNVNHIHEQYERGTELKLEHVKYLQTLQNLTVLHMDLNKLEVLDERILNPNRLPKQLRTFTLSGNRMTYGKYVDYLNNMKSVESLDLSRQHLNYDPFLQDHNHQSVVTHHVSNESGLGIFKCDCIKPPIHPLCITVFLPENLRVLRWRKSFLYFNIFEMIICGPDQLEFVDLSFNLISKWIGPVHGVSSVKYLDLSENYCKDVKNGFFDFFSALEHLNVSGNFLGASINLPRSNETFRKLSNLTLLDLSNNKITNLPKNIFMDLHSLQYLDVSGNMIDVWNSTLDTIRCLKMLDLSNNRLDTLPENLMLYLDSLVDEKCNNGSNITVDLAANPIECTCHTLPFLKRMLNSRVHFQFASNDQCHLQDGKRRFLYNHDAVNDIITILGSECIDRTWIIITGACLGSCIASVIVCICIYRYRWKLRYIYYKRNRRHAHEGFEWLFEQDGFVSYSKNLGSFIKEKLVPALEGSHGLKVWVWDRNSTPGASIAENVTHAIYSSRKSILLINRKYLKEKWCDYEMNMAHTESVETKRKLIIIVLMEDIPTKEYPISLLRLLKNEQSLEYPTHPQDVDTFWSNLADAVMSS